MKNFVLFVILLLTSNNILAEQPNNFNASQSNEGEMVIPHTDDPYDINALHNYSDKSESLSSPYYNDNII